MHIMIYAVTILSDKCRGQGQISGPWRPTKFFKNQTNFLHLLLNQTIKTRKISKKNAAKEKKLRNKTNVREEYWSVWYPCLPPLISCERCGEGDRLMRNYLPHSSYGAPRKEWKANDLKSVTRQAVNRIFYTRNGVSSKVQCHPSRNSGGLPSLEVENSKQEVTG